MKKRILSFLLAFCLSMALLPTNALATYNTNYTLSGNGADDIVSVALAQMGIGGSKGGSEFGFPSTDSWCAYFVCWAGRTAQTDFPSSNLGTPLGVAKWFIENNKGVFYCFRDGNYNSLISEGVKNTGNIVRTTRDSFAPQKGDLICYLWADSAKQGYNWSHIGIVTADYTGNGLVSTVEGNAGGTNLYNGKVETYNQSYDSRIVGIIRPNYSGSANVNNILPYFTCNVRINCINGKTVNLYSNPGDTSREDYFSLGQTVNSTCGMARSDGSTWYRITANQKGTPKTFWLKYESGKMTVTNLMSKGPYTLMPKCASGARLDVSGASAEDGANVQIYTSNSTAAQQWELTYLNNGYYKITSKASGKVLDVAGASTEAGANVQQYTSNGTNAQQWMLKDAGDGYYYIVPRVNTALCLDVAGAGTADGTNVGIYTANGTDAQKWKLNTPEISYIVTFNPNGGSVSTSSKKVTNGSLYGTLPTPTRSGYKFDGWYTSSSGGNQITSSTTVNLSGNQTLYAHWSEQSYTINFNANGGSVWTSSKTVINGDTYGSLPTPTRSGYTFEGWYTSSSGGNQITSSTTVNLSGNQTLYAHWSEQSYTVNFNANGGSVWTSSKTVINGDTYGSLPTPTRSGYTFEGWYTSPHNGSQVTSETTVNLSESQTLYAHWEGVQAQPQPTVSFTDVNPSDWFALPVQWALEENITAGTGDGTTFSPQETCSVAQILTFIWRAYGSPEPTFANTFTDVPSGVYYEKAAVWAREMGLIQGNKLDPLAPCTRAMAVNYLWKAAHSPYVAASNQFADVPSDYAQAVDWAVSNSITFGTSDTTFSPNLTCTRAEIITFLYRDMA